MQITTHKVALHPQLSPYLCLHTHHHPPPPSQISDGQVQDLDIHRLLKRSGIPERDLRQRVAEELDLAAQERLVRRAMDAPSLTALQDRSRAIAEFAYDIRQAAVAGRASEGAPSLRATDDVVRQPRVDLLRLDVGGVVRDALRPRAKLRPARQRAVVASTVPRDLALVVVVQSAEHLPMRAEAAEAVRDAGGYLGPSADEQALLACFAEVLFGDYAVRTQTQIGTSASFNEVGGGCLYVCRLDVCLGKMCALEMRCVHCGWKGSPPSSTRWG